MPLISCILTLYWHFKDYYISWMRNVTGIWEQFVNYLDFFLSECFVYNNMRNSEEFRSIVLMM